MRYLSESKICEQFLGFADVSCDGTSDGLFKQVQVLS